jgi:hypothetical protein
VPTTIEAIAEIELIDTSGEMRVARRAGHPLDPAALVGREAVAIGSPLLLFGLDPPEDQGLPLAVAVDRLLPAKSPVK